MFRTTHHRRAVLVSPEVDVDTLTIDRDDHARVHMACLFRAAQQLTGWCDSQARSHVTLACHCHASVTAVTRAKLEARQPHGDAGHRVSWRVHAPRSAINIGSIACVIT